MDIRIRVGSTQPIYQQIADQIKAAIVSGQLSPGEPLPSIRALAQQLQISVITTKRAYDELEKEGLICTVAAKGCFVAKNNGPRIREERLRQLEAHVLAALELAPACGLSPEDVVDLFRLFAQELSAKE